MVLIVETMDDRKYNCHNDRLKQMMQKGLNDDLVTLSNLDERIVLDELKKRYLQNQIYTYIGDILIAMNPLKMLPIYTKDISYLFKTCDELSKLKPHVFSTAELCYRQMIQTQQSQCILISGESGSGKTETCKLLVEHLLNRTKQFEVCLNLKIEQVNPILEAFGNAKTRINDNSSRFGKYLELYFVEDGSVVGAKFKEYLLEKSRVVYQNENESTFHIFYLLIAGLANKEKSKFGSLLTSYNNLNANQHRYIVNTIDYRMNNYLNEDNRKKFNSIIESFKTIGFTNEDIQNVIRVLISILFIGDIKFTNKNSGDAVKIQNNEIINHVCQLLELNKEEINDALVSDEQITRGEQIRRERNMIQACDIRDAFAKALYGRLFSWIVNQTNHHIQPAQGIIPSYSIGLLDIFGFENFQRNSFEQMCINLANEQLHQLFTKYIFKLEIQECLDEAINLNDDDLISFQDNQIILDLFLEKRYSIFTALDEISKFPQATDQSLATKLHQTLPNIYTDVYIPPKNGGVTFQIVHYAGQVLYNMEGFLEKNRDFLPNNLIYTARGSNNPLIQELFQCKLTRQGTIAPSDRQSKIRKSLHYIQNSIKNQKPVVSYKPSFVKSRQINNNNNNNNNSQSEDNSIITTSSSSCIVTSDKSLPLTVACHFKNSLQELIGKINTSKAYFIRCIKPNPKQENLFIDSFVIKQLRYCSIMHVCKIRKCGYAYRIKFEEFLRWYKPIEISILKKSSTLSQIQRCVYCLNHSKIENDYKIGKTKLFLRYWHIDILNQLSKKYLNQIIMAQKIIRGWLIRNRIDRMQRENAKYFFLQLSDSNLYFNKQVHSTNIKNDFKAILKSNKQQQQLKSTNIVKPFKNDPDQKEINQALEQFDEMLNNFDIDESSSKFNNNNNNDNKVGRSTSFQLSPSAVYSIVHNNNNKYDNTLKKRNALVAFEFKNLVSKYNDTVVTPHYEVIRSNNSRGSTSESRSLSSNSSSNEGVDENSTIHQQPQQKLPLNRNLNNLLSTSLTNLNNLDSSPKSGDDLQSNNKDLIYKSKSAFLDENTNKNRKLSVIDKNQNQLDEHQNSNPNLTIWREELIKKTNFEEKIKKENELARRIEDSKSVIPEWKKRLLEQKEMKKAAANSVISINNANNCIGGLNINASSTTSYYCKSESDETPELMKHNMFIKKKGLATHV